MICFVVCLYVCVCVCRNEPTYAVLESAKYWCQLLVGVSRIKRKSIHFYWNFCLTIIMRMKKYFVSPCVLSK